MPEQLQRWAFETTKGNMEQMYEESGWAGGWKDKEKRAEMTDEKARYLIVHANDDSETPVGLVHFRFELDGKVRS